MQNNLIWLQWKIPIMIKDTYTTLLLSWVNCTIQIWIFDWVNSVWWYGLVLDLINEVTYNSIRCAQHDSTNRTSVYTFGDFHFSRVNHIHVGECLSLFDIILFPKRIQAYSTMRSPNWNIRQRKMSRFYMQCWIKFFL